MTATARAGTLGEIFERADFDDARGYPAAGREVALIERYVRLTKRDVLEVGCGNGRLTVDYAPQAKSVVAIEPHPDLARKARARLRRLRMGNVRAFERPAQTGIRGGPFDVVLFSWSLC